VTQVQLNQARAAGRGVQEGGGRVAPNGKGSSSSSSSSSRSLHTQL
jgi:hypothetical protein